MNFAGFTPQQTYTLLTGMGYNGPAQEDDMNKFMLSNTEAANGMGKMAMVAQRRIDERVAASKGLPTSGKGFAVGGWVDGAWDANAEPTSGGLYSGTGENTTTTTTTEDPAAIVDPALVGDLDAAQQAYADALAAGDAQAIADAQANLTLASQAYNTTDVPSAGEAIGTAINDPESLTTTADVEQITPTNEELIAAGTGQQTEAYTGETATVDQPEEVTAVTAEAAQAEAADRTATALYEASKIGDQVTSSLADLEAAKADPTESATVQGQLEMLMADFDEGTPPWASGAMREASSLMQRRGMGASSMAGEAIVLAAMQAALPIASADAKTYATFELQNLNNEQQVVIFKAQQRIASLFSDQAAENASKQFNAQSTNQTNQFFAGLETQVSQFNSAQINAIRQFNSEQENIASRFNVEQAVTVDLFSAKQQDAMSMFNNQLLQQRDQFNAENDLIISQANAKWYQMVSTTNTATQNLANRDAAAASNNLTTRAIDHLHQYERDLMAYSFQAGESAQDRAIKLLLADKELAIAQSELDWSQDAAEGAAWFEVVKWGADTFF